MQSWLEDALACILLFYFIYFHHMQFSQISIHFLLFTVLFGLVHTTGSLHNHDNHAHAELSNPKFGSGRPTHYPLANLLINCKVEFIKHTWQT